MWMSSRTFIQWVQNSGLVSRLYWSKWERRGMVWITVEVNWVFSIRVTISICLSSLQFLLPFPALLPRLPATMSKCTYRLAQWSVLGMQVHIFFFFSIVMPVLILCYTGSEDEWWPQDTPTKEQTWGSGDGLPILTQIAKHTVCSVCSGVFQPNFIFLMTLWDRYWYCLHLRDEETKFQGGTLVGNWLTVWESQCWAHSFWSSTCVLSCWTLMSHGWGLESINIGL